MNADGSRDRIVLRDIRKSYAAHGRGATGQKLVLDGIDLTIRENEFLTIIGPSGCGKTTLLRIMASLIPADSGDVLVDRRKVIAPSRERAMVFQSFGLFPWKTVLENVKFPLTISGVSEREAAERAMTFLEKVGLAEAAQAHPHQLSGGMQQRVGLARALATEPDVLLMDEPFGAIDAQTRELMQEELMQLWQDTRKTVVFVTHDLDEAVLLADRVLLLSPGPGRVRRLVEVHLPRPRNGYDVRASSEFVRIRSELWKALRGDLLEDRVGRAS
jgi:NitT/TauT family transport system ATP-binding protein